MSEPYLIKMPQLSDTMTEGTLVSWEKSVGDEIRRGTVVATVETDKAIMDVEVFREGFLSGPLVAPGTVVPVGAVIGQLVAAAGDVATGDAKAQVAAGTREVSPVAEVSPQPVAASAPTDAYVVKMPQLSDTMTEGTLVSWEKSVGDEIRRGTVVATVETDKAIMDVEVFREGFLSGPLVTPGGVVPVGAPLAYLVTSREAVIDEERAPDHVTVPRARIDESESAGSPEAPKSRVPAMPQGATPAPRPASGRATPYARQLAGAHGIDLSTVTGHGPGGAVVGADVLSSGGSAGAAKRVFKVPGVGRPMDNMEKAVSHNMEYSLSMPLFRVTVHMRSEALAAQAKQVGVSLTVALAKAAALTIADFPRVNAVYQHEDRIVERGAVDVGVAVETEGMGLVVPVLRNVVPRPIADLNNEWKDLVARARARRLKPAEYANPTFAISNMGMLGVSHFDAIPVPGTSAIMAIATTGADGMPVTLTADHRIINGADAARFLNAFKARVEAPAWLGGKVSSIAATAGAPAVARGPAVLTGRGGYDIEVAVIGGGPGGEDCARDLAAQGRKVVLINDAPFPGGECLWRGCIPSKAWRAAADRLRDRATDRALGIEGSTEGSLKWAALEKARRGVLETRGGLALKTDRGVKIEYRAAFARFVSDHALELQALPAKSDPHKRAQPKGTRYPERLTFEAAVIATGAPPFVPPIPGADRPGVLTSDTVWGLKTRPKKLVIVGAGAIGLEMAQIFADFGSTVTVIEARDRALPEVEAEVARTLSEVLAEEARLTLLTDAQVTGISGTPGKMKLSYARAGKSGHVTCEYVILATGKRPVVEPLALDKAGVRVERGAIAIDGQCRTSVPHIFAVGDVTGGLMLAHTAGHQGRVAADALLGHGSHSQYDRSKDCGVIFTRPQAAFVGLSAEQAKAAGFDPVEIKTPIAIDAKAMINHETHGFIKLVADKASERIVGVHFLVDHADTLIGEAVLMVSAGLTLSQVGQAIHPHPTQTELFGDMARRLHQRLTRQSRRAGTESS